MKVITVAVIIIFSIIVSSCLTVPEETNEEIIIADAVLIKSEKISDEPEKIIAEKSETMDKVEFKEAEVDISILIEKLNSIIESRDYESWKFFLSNEYITYYSDPDVLKEKSKSPLLIKYKVVLRTLEDYFNYVVVGSRQNVKLDEIKVLDRDRIKAYMFVDGTPVIIYDLVRIDNLWRIGIF